MEGINHLDTMWVIIGGALVFFMNAGFALVESGLCRSKNAVNILTKNLIVFGLAVVGFWSVGYALMFGGRHSFIGSTGFFLTGLDPLTGGEGHKVPLNGFFFFQLCFAATAATIVSGAVAERIKIQSFMVFSVVLTAVVYPIIGHWVWGGGWLAKKGFADFAGSTVVHSVGGWAALVGAAMLGPRIGKYSKDGKVQPIAGHNMSMVTLGGLVLMLGWFGFNAGSTLTADGMAISHIVTTTTLGGAMGMVAAALWAWLRMGKPDLTLIVNGMLAGLVGVTAGCAFIEPYSAAIIVASPRCWPSRRSCSSTGSRSTIRSAPPRCTWPGGSSARWRSACSVARAWAWPTRACCSAAVEPSCGSSCRAWRPPAHW